MDLNYLLARHQTSIMRAKAGSCEPSRRAHLGLASGYAAKIDRMRRLNGATERLWPVEVPA